MNLNEKTPIVAEEKYTSDREELSKLNAQFISNFIRGDAAAHDQIMYKDFICIHSDGTFVERSDYLFEWVTGFKDSGYVDFSYTNEDIRIFGNFALIRAKTVFTKKMGNELVNGNSIYTDTYLKENGRWWCIQAQITAVKK